MKNQLTSLLLSATFILTACSKTTEKVVYVPKSSSTDKVTATTAADLLKDWQDLFMDGSTSVQVAEILASQVAVENRQAVQDMLKDFSDEELKIILKDVKESEQKVRNSYFNYGASWSNNPEFLNSTIVYDKNANRAGSLGNNLIITVAAKAKNKLLTEVMDTYANRMSELAKDLAPDFAAEIAKTNPKVAKEIENALKHGDKDLAKEKIVATVKALKIFDDYFKKSGLNDEEQGFIVLSAATAGAIGYKIYDEIKETKTLKTIVRLAKEGKELHAKFKELQVLGKSLQEYSKALAHDTKEFMSSSSAMTKEVGDAFGIIKERGIKVDVDARKSFKYIYDKTIGGKKDQVLEGSTSIATKTWRIDENLDSMVSSAGRISSDFSKVLETSQAMAQTLGIKLSPEISKLVEKAQKVSAIVGMAQKVMSGLASGGVMGAVSAFASGPMSSLIGGGKMGFESRAMAQFAEINRKLNEIIKMQKQMIQMQIETMGMIQKLALLMDQYHQEEMSAIASLRNISVIDLEISKMAMNEGIRSCEKIVSYHLNKNSGVTRLDRPGLDAGIADIDAQKLFEKLGDFVGVQKFIRSTHDMAYAKCQDGITEAFGRGYIKENPILSIYSTTDDNDLKAFYENNYLPLYGILKEKAGDKSAATMGLHAPIAAFKNLDRKFVFINHETGTEVKDTYDIQDLISPIALERYAAQLLILHPYLELDKSEWAQDTKSIFNSYLNIANDSNYDTRSLYLLKNALSMTQAAIAQEAILAGEPILDGLYPIMGEVFKAEDPCQDQQDKKACAIRSNSMLMKNIMLYSLRKNSFQFGFDMSAYEAAYGAKDIKVLESMIFNNEVVGKIAKKNDSVVLQLNKNDRGQTFMAIPTPEEVRDGLVQYSENMDRLVRLQDKLLDALVRITPADAYEQDTKEKLGILMLSKYM